MSKEEEYKEKLKHLLEVKFERIISDDELEKIITSLKYLGRAIAEYYLLTDNNGKQGY